MRRFPRGPLGEEFEEIQSSIELQADLEQFKEQVRRGLLELRETITNVDARLNIRSPGAPTDVSWEAVSERMASKVGRASEVVNESMLTEVEQVV